MVPSIARGLTALAIGGFATLGTMPSAHAATGPCPPGTYPPGASCVTGEGGTVSAQTLKPGGSFALKVTGYAKNVSILVQLRGTKLGSMTSNAEGVATGTFKVPASIPPGSYSVTASGLGANGQTRVVAVSLTIVAADRSLSLTGFEVGAAALLGVGLIGAGTVAVVSGRKRRGMLPA